MSLIDDVWDRFAKIKDSLIYKYIKGNDHWDEWLRCRNEENEDLLTKKQLIEAWMHERWFDFLHDFKAQAVEEDGKLVVHRCISVNPESFIKNIQSKSPRGLGVYWTWHLPSADCHWGDWGKGTSKLFVTGLVDPSSIAIEDTVINNFHPSIGEEEREIQLIEDSPVLVTNVDFEPDTKPGLRFYPPLKLVA